MQIISCPLSAEWNADDYTLQNQRFRVTFDPQTGNKFSLYDKRAKKEVFLGDGAVPLVVEDRSDTWSHNIFSFRTEVGRFVATSVRLVAHGPVKSVVLVDWREQFQALKLESLHQRKLPAM